ncbi:MAG: hypothetical protein II914_06065 [Clostridia bacterium]|nr:hypothetical protein [Clostridia bacterium]
MKQKLIPALICVALFTSLLMTACGPKLEAPSVDLPAPGVDLPAPGAGAKPQAAAKPVDSVKPLSFSGSGTAYDGNGIVVTVTAIEEVDSMYFFGFEIRNNNAADRGITMDYFFVNGMMVPSYGVAELVHSGETVTSEVMISKDALLFAGIPEVGTIKVLLRIEDENYDIIEEDILIPLYTADESLICDPQPAGAILYDKNNVRLSFQGSFTTEYSGQTLFFLLENGSDQTLNFELADYDSKKATGTGSKETVISADFATLPAGTKGLCSVNMFDGETYENVTFETLDMDSVVKLEGQYTEHVPIHVIANGDTIIATADEPYYPDYVLQRMEYDQKKAEEAEDAASAEEVKAPVIEKVGVYTREIGRENDAIITVLVRNPNERTYIGSLSFHYFLYDAKNNQIDSSEADNMLNRVVIRPGETVPCFFMSNRFESGIRAEQVSVTINEYIDMTERQVGRSYGSLLTTQDIHIDAYTIEEGKDWEVPTPEHPFDEDASFRALVTNDRDALEYGMILYVAYDNRGEIIVADYTVLEDVPERTSFEVSSHFPTAVMNLPGYDHAECYVLARSQG